MCNSRASSKRNAAIIKTPVSFLLYDMSECPLLLSSDDINLTALFDVFPVEPSQTERHICIPSKEKVRRTKHKFYDHARLKGFQQRRRLTEMKGMKTDEELSV